MKRLRQIIENQERRVKPALELAIPAVWFGGDVVFIADWANQRAAWAAKGV